MKKKLIKGIKKLTQTPVGIVLKFVNEIVAFTQANVLSIVWKLSGNKKPTKEEVEDVCENVTFIYKSFERQKLAKNLYKSIQSYYPGVKVVIADDSTEPLDLTGENLEIIQLPFNSGLSIGLNRALERVTTPFVVRLDDDEMLTPFTKVERQIKFLREHPEMDLVGILPYNLPKYRSLKKVAELFYNQPMNYAPKKLIIPHLTEIDETHVVVAKTPNIFVARTDKIKEIGYDDNIRMIDHNEFFYRAAGNIVSVLDKTAFVLHFRNWFDTHYNKYRSDYQGDVVYIREKMRKNTKNCT